MYINKDDLQKPFIHMYAICNAWPPKSAKEIKKFCSIVPEW